ncbi:MAG: transcription-repair coupling factor [Bdellovibrionales bacterium]
MLEPKTLIANEPLRLDLQSSIDRWLRLPAEPLELVGSASPLLLASLLLHHDPHQPGPHLVILARSEEVKRLGRALTFLDPSAEFLELPAFDVGIYSNLYANRRVISERVRWLYNAQHAKPGQIFVASLEALLQRTLPFQTLNESVFELALKKDLPADFAKRLGELGYSAVPLVEDVGTFAIRGGIVDIFSPAMAQPVRLELFGNTIDSIRRFDAATQRSLENLDRLVILPASEILPTADRRQRAAQLLKASHKGRPVLQEEAHAALHALAQGQMLQGMEFLISYFYQTPASPLDHFSAPLLVWRPDPLELDRASDQLFSTLKMEYETGESLVVRPHYQEVYLSPDQLELPPESREVALTRVQILDRPDGEKVGAQIEVSASDLREFTGAAKALAHNAQEFARLLESKFKEWRESGHKIFLSTSGMSQSQRLRVLLERTSFHTHVSGEDEAQWPTWIHAQEMDQNLIHLVPRPLPESLRLSQEHLIFLRDEDLFGKKSHAREKIKKRDELEVQTAAISFADLKPGDLIVHKLHGVGVYEGLKVMQIQGVEAELIQLKYKDNDRLYLPVFRISQIHKFSGPSGTHVLDKLGGQSWDKVKGKVRSHLRDVAADLLQLYAERSQTHRPALPPPDEDFAAFEAAFPYDETNDQLRAIQDIIDDLCHEKPMDRLICGDVGFGKTEVALRAAFKVAQTRKQVAVIAPTTVLTFQHTETFKRRFKDWPLNIRSLNRFVGKSEISETLKGLKSGEVDIVIGTHRLLSRDVEFKDLGLLIVDEEQKFGVQHKERLRKLRVGVDTLAMSATPIPRTLNLSLMGLRDLSIINTPPADRLPTRTFVTRFDPETLRKAILSEIHRGGQVFFIHNRIESIYGLMDELRAFLPDVRMGLAHGQMEEGQLEKVMVSFFNHEIDMLVCTTIIESGMDIPRANTMFIDNAHQLGLSQLYQLRGRVGRSKERAYCYLLIPNNRRIEKDAQERLRVIQENTALGSGIRIAQYDLELRGAGDLLGEEQSGHIDAVGYEMYLELLEEAVNKLKGQPATDEPIEPDINVRIPALIPDRYISDIRLRLSYYRSFADIRSPEDMDRLEEDLRDQYGQPPEPTINLMGLMLIRHCCRQLSVKDLSSGKNGISLLFTDKTPLPPQRVLELASRENKRFSVTPDSRLHIRIASITWPRIYEELLYLLSLC